MKPSKRAQASLHASMAASGAARGWLSGARGTDCRTAIGDDTVTAGDDIRQPAPGTHAGLLFLAGECQAQVCVTF